MATFTSESIGQDVFNLRVSVQWRDFRFNAAVDWSCTTLDTS